MTNEFIEEKSSDFSENDVVLVMGDFNVDARLPDNDRRFNLLYDNLTNKTSEKYADYDKLRAVKDDVLYEYNFLID